MTDATLATRPIRIMVVDDHAMVAESLRRALDQEDGIEVVAVARDAAEAVSLAQETQLDVILMDLVLPDIGGVEAARIILANGRTARILALTGAFGRTSVHAAIEAGCVGYLEKHATMTDLVAAIRRAHAGELVLAADDLRLVLARRGSAVDAGLTRREHEVLVLLSEGLGNRGIAERLAISVDTVRTHVQRVLAKLDVHSRLEAVAEARRRHLIP